MDRYAQANKERSDSERLRVEEQGRRISEMERRRSAMAERQREEVERQKQAHSVRDRQLRANAMDRELGEQERLARIEPNPQRAFSDYPRNEPASQYPQGRTEGAHTASQ